MDMLQGALALAAQNLIAPAILFFLLGAVAGFGRSDLALPEPVTRSLSLYLMLCIGFKGGVEAAKAGWRPDFMAAAGSGIALSFLFPLLAYVGLRWFLKMERVNAAATAAAYGSAASELLKSQGINFEGHMAAVLAVMEAPAIVTGLLIAGLATKQKQADSPSPFLVAREVIMGAPALMLAGSFVIGMATGDRGLAKLDLFVNPLFQGILCLFLLEMGRTAALSISRAGAVPLRLVAAAIVLPASIGLMLAKLTGLPQGDAVLLTVLAGSASYIAVPSAMRMALPQADPGVYLTMALGISFPFNLLIGIPLYQYAVMQLAA
jgi:uncharacterized protein